MLTLKFQVCQENYLPVGILYHFDHQEARAQRSEIGKQTTEVRRQMTEDR